MVERGVIPTGVAIPCLLIYMYVDLAVRIAHCALYMCIQHVPYRLLAEISGTVPYHVLLR